MTLAPSNNEIALFLAVLARVGGLLVTAPLVGDVEVPRRVKIGLTVALSLAMMTVPAVDHQRVPTDLAAFSAVIVVQVVTGLALGFVARVLFLVAETAGGVVSLSTGFSTAAVLNPLTQAVNPLMMQLYTLIASLVFLALNGEAWVVAALARSFSLAPVAGMAIAPHLFERVITALSGITLSGLMLALPVAASLLASNLVLGVLARALPQFNIFMLAMSIDVLLGLVALLLGLAGTLLVLGQLSSGVAQTLLSPLASL